MDLSPVGLRWLVLKTNCLHWIIPHPTSLISVYADEIADITESVQTVTESLSVLLSLRRQSQWRHQKTIATVQKWPMMFSPSSDIWQFVAVPMMSDDEAVVTGLCWPHWAAPGMSGVSSDLDQRHREGNFDQFDPLQLPITRCCLSQPITELHWHLLANERPGLESPVTGKVNIQFAINTQLLTGYCAPVIGPRWPTQCPRWSWLSSRGGRA